MEDRNWIIYIVGSFLFVCYTLLPSLSFLWAAKKARAKESWTFFTIASLMAGLFLCPHIFIILLNILYPSSPVHSAARVESDVALLLLSPLLAFIAWPIALLLAKYLPKTSKPPRTLLYTTAKYLVALALIAGFVFPLSVIIYAKIIDINSIAQDRKTL